MSEAKELLRVLTGDGKYTVVQDADGTVRALRYGAPWRRDLAGDNLVLSLAQDLDASRAREKALVEALRHARDQIRHPDQLIDEALQPYSTPSPDMPSDCHPQGE